MILRAAAAALCLVLLAGCGGGDDDGKAGYERALNTFCSAMEKGAERVSSDSAKLQTSDPQARLRGIGSVLGAFATTMERAVAKLRTADVPGDYKKLNGDIVDGVRGYVTKLREASRQAADGNAAGVQAIGSSLRDQLPRLPQKLAKKTPACGSAA